MLSSFRSTFRSELVKLTNPTALAVGLIPAGFVIVSMVLAVGNASDQPDDRGPVGIAPSRQQLAEAGGLADALGTSALFLGVVSLCIAAASFGGEYSRSTLRNLLMRQPRRLVLVAGKSACVACYLAAAVALSCVAGALAGFALAPTNDVSTAAWTTAGGYGAAAATTGNLIVASLAWAAVGSALAIFARSPTAAIAGGLAYAIPGEIVLTSIEPIRDLLPGEAFRAVATGGSPDLSYPAALVVVLVWCGAATAASWSLFVRRDVLT